MSQQSSPPPPSEKKQKSNKAGSWVRRSVRGAKDIGLDLDEQLVSKIDEEERKEEESYSNQSENYGTNSQSIESSGKNDGESSFKSTSHQINEVLQQNTDLKDTDSVGKRKRGRPRKHEKVQEKKSNVS